MGRSKVIVQRVEAIIAALEKHINGVTVEELVHIIHGDELKSLTSDKKEIEESKLKAKISSAMSMVRETLSLRGDILANKDGKYFFGDENDHIIEADKSNRRASGHLGQMTKVTNNLIRSGKKDSAMLMGYNKKMLKSLSSIQPIIERDHQDYEEEKRWNEEGDWESTFEKTPRMTPDFVLKSASEEVVVDSDLIN